MILRNIILIVKCLLLLVSEAKGVPIISHIWVTSSTFNVEKVKLIFMTILGLPESFKTINRSDPAGPDRNAL